MTSQGIEALPSCGGVQPSVRLTDAWRGNSMYIYIYILYICKYMYTQIIVISICIHMYIHNSDI